MGFNWEWTEMFACKCCTYASRLVLNLRKYNTSPVHSVSLTVSARHMTAPYLPPACTAVLRLLFSFTSRWRWHFLQKLCQIVCIALAVLKHLTYLEGLFYISIADVVVPACQCVWQLFTWSCLHVANCKLAQRSSELSFNLLRFNC